MAEIKETANMNAQQFTQLTAAFQAIGDAARNAERRGDDLGNHSISNDEGEASANAMMLVRAIVAGA